jgi:hypothetical protein
MHHRGLDPCRRGVAWSLDCCSGFGWSRVCSYSCSLFKPTCPWFALPGQVGVRGEALSTVHRLAWQNQTTCAEVYLFFESRGGPPFLEIASKKGPVRCGPLLASCELRGVVVTPICCRGDRDGREGHSQTWPGRLGVVCGCTIFLEAMCELLHAQA